MPAYNLPPDTRATGTGSPAADMDSVTDVLNHTVLGKVFYLDQYGADNTGVTLSDTAWANCYTDAAAACQAAVAKSGSMIVLGCGVYKFSVNTVKINDCRIGLRGQGKWATTITTTGSTGDLVYITDSTGAIGQSAPISGFTVWGWQAGNGVNAIRYGSRSPGNMTDVHVTGFGGTGSRGFWFIDDLAGSLSERSFFQLDADQNTVNYCFDGSASTISSHDYSHMYLGTNTLTNGNACTAVQWVNGAHCVGSFIQVSGNVNSNNASYGVTLFQVGASGSDNAHLNTCQLQVGVECDGSSAAVKDFVIQGVSGAGILHCMGPMFLINVGGTFSGGSVTSPAVFTHAGAIFAAAGSVFNTHGTLTALGTGGALSTYAG